MKQPYLFFSVLALLSLLPGCGPNASDKTSYEPSFTIDTAQSNTLIFGFPSFSYNEIAEPFIKYLNQHLKGYHIKMKTCTSYAEYLDDLENHRYDLTLINGMQGIEAEKNGYVIFGKVMDDKDYCGAIFVNKMARVVTIDDLSNKKISIVSSNTIPGTIMSLYYLFQHGVDVNKNIVPLNVSSFESAIIATYAGKCDAGVCLKRSWDVYIKNHPEILSRVELKWETPHLINNALLFDTNTNPQIRAQISNLLFSMQQNPEGKEALAKLHFAGFEKANTNTYKPMLDFKTRYDSVIHLKEAI